MSKFNDLMIEQLNEAVEIAAKIEEVKNEIDAYQAKYAKFFTSNNPLSSEGEKTLGGRLYINAGIVRLLESSPEQLVVKFQ